MIGIMQGRLTKPKGRGIQFFPFDNWEQEFYDAKEIGINEIEFIFDYDNYVQNPLWTSGGRTKLKEVLQKTGIRVSAVCFDYFMRYPFFKMQEWERENTRKKNTEIINVVLDAMLDIGADLIEIPLVDSSSMKMAEEKEVFRQWLSSIIDMTDSRIRFALETDLPPKEFLDYILSFHIERLGANYDSGNSSGIGYDLYEEVKTLQEHIFNIHIKDRIYHGTTVSLGTGSADFEALFKGLSEIKYSGNFILQAARGKEGDEKVNILSQMDFVLSYIEKYGV